MNALIVTGMQVLTSVGFGTEQLPELKQLSALDGTTIPDLSPREFGFKGLNRVSRASRLSCMTIGQALGISGQRRTDGKAEGEHRTGLLVGTNYSNLDAIADLYRESQEFGVQKVNPGIFPETVLNGIGGHAAIYFGLSGVNVTVSNGAGTGVKTLDYACSLLRDKLLTRVVATIVNLHPPAVFSAAILDSRPTCESVVALVLERESGQSAHRLANIDVRLAAKGDAEGALEVAAEHASLAVAVALRDLITGEQSGYRLCIPCGAEGDYVIALESASEPVSADGDGLGESDRQIREMELS
ncbi:MAG: beta-ketoacyl synthase [Brevibacillus sp.]|nr:beta-ketoacyl synthase [Brevibacillus sp.]